MEFERTLDLAADETGLTQQRPGVNCMGRRRLDRVQLAGTGARPFVELGYDLRLLTLANLERVVGG